MTIVIDPDNTPDPQDKSADPSAELEQIPEKYRGKSVIELVGVLKNLESDRGRMANEVGSLRKLTDQVLGLARDARFAPANQSQTPDPLTTEDLLADPEKAVSDIVRREARQSVADTEKRTTALENQLALDRLARKHPGFEETLETDEFQSWMKKSPYRVKLAQKAADNDFDAADELISTFKEMQPAKAEKEEETPDPLAPARNASLAKRGGSSAQGVGNSGGSGKKTYMRNELIDLRINKPEEYEARYTNEILPAYREGRVK